MEKEKGEFINSEGKKEFKISELKLDITPGDMDARILLTIVYDHNIPTEIILLERSGIDDVLKETKIIDRHIIIKILNEMSGFNYEFLLVDFQVGRIFQPIKYLNLYNIIKPYLC